jgi:beta-galactosidase
MLGNKIRAAAIAVAFIATAASANITERRENQYLQARTKTRIDEGWKILIGSNPSGAQNTAFNDASWTTTNVPYDMANVLVGTGKGTDPGQKGWFRKHFTVPTGTSGKQVVVQFDGVYHDAVVYINGTQVASQEYGYVSFKADITKYLNLTGDNVLAVWVDNLTVQTSRWYSGSGIFRHVWLITTDPVHLTNWGTAITTPSATAASSTVKINTDVTNETSSSASRTLVTVICDSTGKRIDSVSTPITVAANTTTTFSQSIAMTGCNLWSPSNPYVYNAYTEILNGTTLADDYVTPFGIRNITYSTSGLFINGVNTKIKGICMHQTMVPVGSAVPEQMWMRVIKQLQAAGVNSIRTSHCPMEPEFYDLCDKMGMLVMDEWCDKWKNPSSNSYYQDWDNVWQADLTLFLKRDRNHPCIYIWSYGNEVDPGGGSISQYEYTMSGDHRAGRQGHRIVQALHPRRLERVLRRLAGVCQAGPVRRHRGRQLQRRRIRHRNQRRPERRLDGDRAVPVQYQLERLREQAPGAGPAHLDGNGLPRRDWALGGKLRVPRRLCLPQDLVLLPEGIYGTDPVVKLGVGNPNGSAWVTPTLSESWNQSGSQNVVVYSNCQSVSLYLNGTLLGTKSNLGTPSTSQFTVNWASGTLKVVGSNNGTQVAVDSLITVGAATKVVIQSDRTTLYADGDDVANLDVYITDANGNHVWNATNTLTYTVTGNGRSYGIGTGDLTKAQNFTGNSHAAYEGRAYIPVQSTPTPGSITVSVTASGLAAGSIALTTVPQPAAATTGLAGRSVAAPEALSFALKSGLRSVEMDYQLNQASPVRISVLLPDGRTVEDFNEGTQSTGAHSWSWAGIPGEHAYFVRLQADGRSTTKMLVVP